MQKISDDVLEQLNSMIQKETPFIKVIKSQSSDTFCIEMIDTKYVSSEYHPLNVTKELINDVEQFFKEKGNVQLAWNNTRTTFWIIPQS